MAGEFFQSERGEISGVEAQATKEKKTDVVTALQQNKALFQGEVSKAGKLLADADGKVSLPESKDKIKAYKEDIAGTLKEIVTSGRMAIEAKNPIGDLAVMDMLASSLKFSIEKVKQYSPLFADVEGAAAEIPKIEEKLKKVRDAKKNNGTDSKEFKAALGEVDDARNKKSIDEIYAWFPENMPEDMKKVLNAVLLPMKDKDAEIMGYHLEVTLDEALTDNTDDLPEAKEGKAQLRILKVAKAKFDDAQSNMKKLSEQVAESDMKKLSNSVYVSISFDNLTDVFKKLKEIDRSKINDPGYQVLYDDILGKTQMQLMEISTTKANIKTYELVTKGLSDEEKICVQLDDKGNVIMTEEFYKLPEDKQMALKAKFKLIQIQVAAELDEKTSDKKEKKMIEGRKKLMAGDVFGAKEDLLSYVNAQKKDPEHDPERYEQCREMLKQIALMELAQMVQRLAAMKESVKSRYNNVPGAKTDYGTWTNQQAIDNIDDMARIIDAAQVMIEKGEVITIEDAEAKLRKFEFPPNTVGGVQALDEKVADIKQKKPEDLQKSKDERLKTAQEKVKGLEEYIRKIQSGEITGETLGGEAVSTVEFLKKQQDKLDDLKKGLTRVEGMTLEDERQAELEPAQADLNKAKFSESLKHWKAGFPVDINSNSWEQFDMFVQQRKLNEADPVKRKETYLAEAKKAREHGFTKLAISLYEQGFAEELDYASIHVNKADVRKKFLEKSDNVKKLDKALGEWEKNFKKQMGRDPSQEESQNARAKMEEVMVGEAYSKEVKHKAHYDMKYGKGPYAEAWKDAYNGFIALEDFGQEGAFTAAFTDEDWNSLPIKVGVMTSIAIVSGGLADVAVGAIGLGGGMGSGVVIGEATAGEAVAVSGLTRTLTMLGNRTIYGVTYATTSGLLTGSATGNWATFESPLGFMKAFGLAVTGIGALKKIMPASRLGQGLVIGGTATVISIGFGSDAIQIKDIHGLAIGGQEKWPELQAKTGYKTAVINNAGTTWLVSMQEQDESNIGEPNIITSTKMEKIHNYSI